MNRGMDRPPTAARLASFLALAVLLAALGLPARAATMPDWVPLQFDATTAARHATDDAVVLIDHLRCEVLSDGGRACVRRFAVKVLTQDGEDAARVNLYRSSFVRYSKVKGWVMRPSGRVETFDEDDGTLRSLGDVTEIDDAERLSLAPPTPYPARSSLSSTAPKRRRTGRRTSCACKVPGRSTSSRSTLRPVVDGAFCRPWVWDATPDRWARARAEHGASSMFLRSVQRPVAAGSLSRRGS